MNTRLSPPPVARFRATLTAHLGLSLTGVPDTALDELLTRRAQATGRAPDAYLDQVAATDPELGALARELTTGETYFFRHPEQYQALASVALPERLHARRAGPHRLRLLSAGCSSGEEAYTMAMVLRDTVPQPGWDVSIVGVDANPAMVERARAGRYSAWSLRATPDGARRRWFRAVGEQVEVDEAIRAAVAFRTGNLAAPDDPDLWLPGAYDVIFCRNVLIYFTGAQIRAVTSRLVESLAPGGFLFLGHAEIAHGRVTELTLRHSHDTFYFQREPLARRTVTAAPPAPAAQPPQHRHRGPREGRWQDVLGLMRAERFDEALAVTATLDHGTDEVAVAHAALLIQHGDLDRARALCRALLDRDGLHAGAHYLLGLCHEGYGDPEAAAEHDRRAAYLDPGFAMPRLRLGLLARRAGDPHTARRELESALRLIACEDEHRLLLFGGGFNRATLAALCRAELEACR